MKNAGEAISRQKEKETEPVKDENVVTVTVYEDNPRGVSLAMGVFMMPLMIVCTIVLGVPIMYFSGGMSIGSALLVTIISEILVTSLAGRLLSKQDHLEFTLKNILKILRIDSPRKKHIAVGALSGLSIWLIHQVVSTLIALSGASISSSDTSKALAGTSGFSHILIFFILTPVVIPFIEEVFFRAATIRCVQNGIKSKTVGSIVAVILSTVSFGVAHIQGFSTVTDLVTVLFTSSVGMLNAILFVKQDSIWGAYASHLTYNGVIVLTSVIFGMS